MQKLIEEIAKNFESKHAQREIKSLNEYVCKTIAPISGFLKTIPFANEKMNLNGRTQVTPIHSKRHRCKKLFVIIYSFGQSKKRADTQISEDC